MTPRRSGFLTTVTDLAIHQGVGYWCTVRDYRSLDNPAWVEALAFAQSGERFLLDPWAVASGIRNVFRAHANCMDVGVDADVMRRILVANAGEDASTLTWVEADVLVQMFAFGRRMYLPPAD